MPDAPEAIIQECINCGALVDTTDEEPLALIHCPNCGAAARVRRTFDTFEIQELLGAGGMGAVYRALDKKLNRPVALKVLRREHMDNPDLIDSLAKEAAITASINHPHVVKVYTTGTAYGVFYIAMELVDKGSLDDLMGLQGKVPELQVLEVGIQIAQGLNAALDRGLIHRDVKPGNILFANAHTAKITDFGLAVIQAQVGQETGEVWGTPYYVAPEKLDTPPREDFRSDLYSLGATLFHALAGRPPFEAETASMVALKHLKSQAVSLQSFAPEISSATAYVINKALSKDPQQRYQSYEEFAKSLQYAHDQVVEASRNPQKKRRLVVGDENEEAMSWITFGMVALIVLAGVLTFTFREKIFARSAEATPPPTPSAGTASPGRSALDTEIDAARKLLAEGKFGDAAVAFRTLDEKGGAQQPLQNWITLQGGLAFFLLGQPDEARAELIKVEKRGIYSQSKLDESIATFFVEIAHLAGTPDPQPAEIAAKFEKTSYQSFALLLLAAKNWQLGAFDDAGPLFNQFKSATPKDNYAWINLLKPVGQKFIDDYSAYRPAADAVKAADSPEKQREALEALRTARTKLQQRGKIIEYFDREEGRLEKLLRIHDEKVAEMMAAAEAADAKAIAAMKSSLNSYLAQFKFAEANGIVSAAALASDKAKAEKDLWANYTSVLARFKTTLVNDINAKGYAAPVARKNGTNLPAGTLRASDSQIELVSQFGNLATTWTDLAPGSIINIAGSFLRADTTATAPDRQWQLGHFLLQAGMKPQGLKLLEQAAAARPEYQEWLPRYQEAFAAP
jgi:hypothetical protein